jgi:hypothetical protein
VLALLGCAAFAAPSAHAHHSFAPVDVSTTIVIEGEVTEFQWTNPHSWVVLDVAGEDGATESWSVEMSAPVRLFRLGWRREDVAVGDRLALEVHPRRDGAPGGTLIKATLADGSERHDRPVERVGGPNAGSRP